MTHSLVATLPHQSPHCAATQVCICAWCTGPAHKMSAYLMEHHRAAHWQIPRSKFAFDQHFCFPLGWRHRQRCRDVVCNFCANENPDFLF